jgi:glycosyltransferase involved in cell wall biosynthesis
VVTGQPSYNIVTKSNYVFFGIKKDNFNKIKIIRLPTYPRVKNSYFSIFLNYFTYIFSGIFYEKKLYPNIKFDIVFVYGTSPIFQAIPALWFSKKRNAKSILWIQDLWPQVLKDLKIINNFFILYLLKYFVNLIYSKFDLILVQSPYFKKYINDKVLKNKIITHFNPGKEKILKSIYKKNKSLKILFTGNIGRVQSFETLIKTALEIKKNNLKIIFEIIGEGSLKQWLIKMISKYELNDFIKVKDHMHQKKLNKYLISADGLLIMLNKGGALSSTIPAKFQTYLSFGKPLIVSADGILSNLVKKNNLGFVSNAENSLKLYKSILTLAKSPSNKIKKIKNNCLYFYTNNFEIKENSKKLFFIFKQLTNNR